MKHNALNLISKIHKIQIESRNRNKNICFILDLLEDFFKKMGVKQCQIIGGFTRDILIKGSWDKIEYAYENKGKDIDVSLDKNDFYLFKFNLKSMQREGVSIVAEGETSVLLEFHTHLPYTIKVDVFYPMNCVDILSSTMKFDIYKRKFVGLWEIYRYIVRGEDGVIINKYRVKERSVELIRILSLFVKNGIPMGKKTIKNLQKANALIDCRDFSFLKPYLASYSKYLNDNFIEVYYSFCDLFGLNNYKLMMDYILKFHRKEESVVKRIGKKDSLKLKFSKYRFTNVDMVNICHSLNFKESICFYMTLRTNGISTSLEIGKHNGRDWEKEEFPFKEDDDFIELSIDSSKILVEAGEIKYETRNDIFRQDILYVLNYDCKQEGS